MAQLAIKGHTTRGKEVIKILEMLGGVNQHNYSGDSDNLCFYIINEQDTDIIVYDCVDDFIWDDEVSGMLIFTLEEFLKKYPYKVGDMVRVPEYESEVCIDDMKWNGFEIQYSVSADETESLYEWYSVEELNKCDEPYKEKIVEEKSVNHVYNVDDVDVISFDIAQKDIYELDLKDNFLVILREGKYYVERIKPKYPKTYEECCSVLGMTYDYPDIQMVSIEECNLYSSFIQLIRCRDAYWKIAGEEMGLGKPWKPTYETLVDNTYFTIHTFNGKIDRSCTSHRNSILAFPTEEMRDTFYENFKYLIESCKEFL